jgi:pimeloyl-ACP methyl ester carboxylesterase
MRTAMRTFQSFDGLQIAYIDEGAGATVVLLHGYTGTVETTWRPIGIIELLHRSGMRVVALDLRGHGASACPHELERYEDRALARDVVALADHLGLEGYHLVGYSLGSIVAASVALLDERVRSLVLGGLGDKLMDTDWARPRDLLVGLLGDEEAARREPMVALVSWVIENLGGDRHALAAVQHGHVPVEPDELATISVPTLVITGTDDDVNGDPRPLVAAIADAQLVRPAGDHVTTLDNPELPSSILAFLRSRDL